MRLFAPLVANPLIVVLLLTMLILLIVGAVLVAWNERRAAMTVGFPAHQYPQQRLTASAPLDALAGLHTRLVELHQHLPPGSEEARWLAVFTRRLRMVMDEAYTRLEAAPPAQRNSLLERLGVEVAAFAGVINLQLGATLTSGTDRQALEAQLSALRAALTR